VEVAEHARAIRSLERRNGTMRVIERRNIFKIGEHLIAVKERLGHGRFLPWVDREFEWSDRTAANYMNVVRAFEFETVSNLDITISALYRLAGCNMPRVCDAAIEIAQRGHRINEATADDMVARCWKTIRRPEDDAMFGHPVLDTLGFFGFDKKRAEVAKEHSSEDVVPRLALVLHNGRKVIDRECDRRKKQAILSGQGQLNRYFARKVWSEFADLVIAEYVGDPDKFDLLQARMEVAHHKVKGDD
jgi:Protein of unknown function (DUF3102)